jgi:hypothetical protein
MITPGFSAAFWYFRCRSAMAGVDIGSVELGDSGNICIAVGNSNFFCTM